MKNIQFLLIVFCSIFISCNTNVEDGSPQDKTIEGLTLQCYYNENVGIQKYLYELETHFINFNVLESDKGIDYINAIRNLQLDNSILYNKQFVTAISQVRVIPSTIDCKYYDNYINDEAWGASLFTKIKNEMNANVNGDFNKKIFEPLLNNLSEKDFNHKLYQSLFLATVSNEIILNFFTKKAQQQDVKIGDVTHTYEIEVNDLNQIIFDGERIGLEDVTPLVKQYLKKHTRTVFYDLVGNVEQSTVGFKLITTEKAEYRRMHDVKSEIGDAFTEIWTETAFSLFEEQLLLLNYEQKRIVTNVYPKVVID